MQLCNKKDTQGSESDEEEQSESDEEEQSESDEEEQQEKRGTGSSALDRLTMELMMPKHAYNRYLLQNDMAQFKEKQLFSQKVNRYRKDIERTVTKCLNQIIEGPLQDTSMSFSAAVNADSLACFEQLCKIVVNDLEVQRSSSEMFTKCDVSRYSLDNFGR